MIYSYAISAIDAGNFESAQSFYFGRKRDSLFSFMKINNTAGDFSVKKVSGKTEPLISYSGNRFFR